MSTELTLNAYSYLTDINKLTKDKTSCQDYICLLFEASFKHTEGEMPKKIYEDNFVFAASLLIDYYVDENNKEELQINFDLLESNTTEGVSYEILREYTRYSEKAYKPKTFKKYNIEGDYSIKIKKNYSITLTDQYSNLTEALKEFYSNHIEQQLSQIEPYLKQNKVGYNQKEFNNFIGASIKNANLGFTKEGMSAFEDGVLYNKVYEVDASLSAKNLEKELPRNDTAYKKNKI
jgi:hypothetical protein